MDQQKLFEQPASKYEYTCGKCVHMVSHAYSDKLKYCGTRDYMKVKSRDRACPAFEKK